MTGSIRMCAAALAVASLMSPVRAAAGNLDVTVTGGVVRAARGSNVMVTATLTNLGTQVMFLTGISSGVTPDFAQQDLFDDFQTLKPDSLGPGESWEGPVLALTVDAAAPVALQVFDLRLTGGESPYANNELGFTYFAVDDSTTLVGVPTNGAGGVTFRVSPNPFRQELGIDFVAAEPGPYTVEVHDVTGRRVALLHAGDLTSGSHRMTWNGRSDGGARASSGVYFVRVVHGGRLLKTKVLKLD